MGASSGQAAFWPFCPPEFLGFCFFCILQKKLFQASRSNSLQLSRTCASWVGRCPGHVATCKVVTATSWARASAATGPDSLELEVENLMEEEFKRQADPWPAQEMLGTFKASMRALLWEIQSQHFCIQSQRLRGPRPVQGWLKQRSPATGRARASVDAGPDRLEPELENQMDEELKRRNGLQRGAQEKPGTFKVSMRAPLWETQRKRVASWLWAKQYLQVTVPHQRAWPGPSFIKPLFSFIPFHPMYYMSQCLQYSVLKLGCSTAQMRDMREFGG